jgi:hypothetical protein
VFHTVGIVIDVEFRKVGARSLAPTTRNVNRNGSNKISIHVSIFIRKRDGKRTREMHRLREMDGIEVALNHTDCALNSSGSGKGPVAGSCEHDYELSYRIKGGEVKEIVTSQQDVCSSVS